MMIPALQHQNTAWKRWLGLLLLTFILYGTTVEAAHRHGRILSSNSSAVSLVESEQPFSPVNNNTGCGECLICQLNQNFTTTLVVFRLADPPAQALIDVISVVVPDVPTRTAGTTAGRAPPFIS